MGSGGRRWMVGALAVLAACEGPCDPTGSLTRLTANLVVEPSDVDFGAVFVGSAAVQAVELSNDGGAAAGLLGFRLLGEGMSLLTPLPTTLAGGERLMLELQLAPAALGAVAGRFSVQGADEAGEPEVFLTGLGVPAPTCADDNPCTDDRFDPELGFCVFEPREGSCQDAAPCLEEARCVDGACLGAPRACPAPSSCAVGVCDPASGCEVFFDAAACDDDDPCTDDSCTEAGCVHTTRADGELCGAVVGCDAVPVCLAGQCTPFPVPDGLPCPTGDECQPGTCQAGACVGTPLPPEPVVTGVARGAGGAQARAVVLDDDRVVVVDAVQGASFVRLTILEQAGGAWTVQAHHAEPHVAPFWSFDLLRLGGARFAVRGAYSGLLGAWEVAADGALVDLDLFGELTLDGAAGDGDLIFGCTGPSGSGQPGTAALYRLRPGEPPEWLLALDQCPLEQGFSVDALRRRVWVLGENGEVGSWDVTPTGQLLPRETGLPWVYALEQRGDWLAAVWSSTSGPLTLVVLDADTETVQRSEDYAGAWALGPHHILRARPTGTWVLPLGEVDGLPLSVNLGGHADVATGRLAVGTSLAVHTVPSPGTGLETFDLAGASGPLPPAPGLGGQQALWLGEGAVAAHRGVVHQLVRSDDEGWQFLASTRRNVQGAELGLLLDLDGLGSGIRRAALSAGESLVDQGVGGVPPALVRLGLQGGGVVSSHAVPFTGVARFAAWGRYLAALRFDDGQGPRIELYDAHVPFDGLNPLGTFPLDGGGGIPGNPTRLHAGPHGLAAAWGVDAPRVQVVRLDALGAMTSDGVVAVSSAHAGVVLGPAVLGVAGYPGGVLVGPTPVGFVDVFEREGPGQWSLRGRVDDLQGPRVLGVLGGFVVAAQVGEVLFVKPSAQGVDVTRLAVDGVPVAVAVEAGELVVATELDLFTVEPPCPLVP